MNNNKLRCGTVAKFSVFKTKDIEKYLSKEQISELGEILSAISEGRLKDGKAIDNEYLVINTDEKYAPEIIEIMKKNEHWG